MRSLASAPALWDLLGLLLLADPDNNARKGRDREKRRQKKEAAAAAKAGATDGDGDVIMTRTSEAMAPVDENEAEDAFWEDTAEPKDIVNDPIVDDELEAEDARRDAAERERALVTIVSQVCERLCKEI